MDDAPAIRLAHQHGAQPHRPLPAIGSAEPASSSSAGPGHASALHVDARIHNAHGDSGWFLAGLFHQPDHLGPGESLPRVGADKY
jgi:hypothetical protein